VGRQICLNLLELAPRTSAQLADAMRRSGVPDEKAESVLKKLTDAGLIDDTAFARSWVESRHHSRGLSRRSLSEELKQRGVGSDNISEAVEALDPEQEIATARRLVERKLASTRGQRPEARARKVAGMLARKGYPAGLTFRLIREALERDGALEQAEALDQEDFHADIAGESRRGPLSVTTRCRSESISQPTRMVCLIKS
jgi:regulatory protein